ncbi:MAG: DUF4062 domain-containing protein [Chloroflexi bacterium]|nr:DUF4062 domain-containing protein [Chloroflexota bacterium]
MRDLIRHLGLKFIGMEEFDPSREPPSVFIQRRVNEARVYLGVLGMRYGSIDASSGLSMTELEYRQAIASDKELHMFVLDRGAPITVDMVETDPPAYAKLLDFKRRVLQAHVCAMFTDVNDLLEKAEHALQAVRRASRG